MFARSFVKPIAESCDAHQIALEKNSVPLQAKQTQRSLQANHAEPMGDQHFNLYDLTQLST